MGFSSVDRQRYCERYQTQKGRMLYAGVLAVNHVGYTVLAESDIQATKVVGIDRFL